MTNTARFLFTKKTWGLVFAALLMVTIHAPARADRPCSGGDDNFARPIAAILQPNASVYNPNGRFEVAMKSNADLTTDITIRHLLGDKQLFRAITRLKTSNPSSAVVGQLPVNEGLGFSIQVVEGGSGYTEICTYGFRLQQGIVSYRTLAARAETREGGVHAGDATAWNAVSKQSPVPIFGGPALPSPPSNMAGTTPAVAPVVPLPKLTEPELTKVASAYEYALLAEAVYSGRTPITLDTRAGTIRWQQSDRQIQTFPGTNFGLGFKASTYWRRDSVSRKVVCAVVFAGTDLPDPVDWANNIRQAEGSLAAEYEQGAMYAAKVSSGACRTASKIVLVGHSLGGGIAQYAFAKTGGIHETWTFNSAGLSVMNVTKALEWMPYIGSARVSNLIAQAYDAADGRKLIGHEPASVTGVQLTTPLRVPVYGFRLPHLIDVIGEGIGIQRDYCLAAGGCEGKEGAQPVSQMLQASADGLSEAKFGMKVDAVEKALGKKLLFDKGSRQSQCGRASIEGLSGTSLRFEDGRFIVVEITQPTVSTNVGFMIGNFEKDVISRLQKDPTYIRGENRYDETLQEIIVGKSKFVVKGINDGYWQGRVMKITSKLGKITKIELGESSYVMLDEHEGDECAFGRK